MAPRTKKTEAKNESKNESKNELKNEIKLTTEHITTAPTTGTVQAGAGAPTPAQAQAQVAPTTGTVHAAPETCDICVEKFNQSFRCPVKCEYCDFKACRECCERYILMESEAHCMASGCARPWTHEFVSKTFTKKFVTQDLKLHREKVLFDKQRALLPATQPLVENILKREDYMRRINAANEVVNQARRDMNKIQSEYFAFINRGKGDNERATFIRACPSPDCRGFLSSQWKCGICNLWTCPTCHEIKGAERDGEHVCDPNNVATANLLNADTKPCPKCGEGIFKIDGCFAANVPILMWDSTVKMSQDIVVGDVLVGDDGQPRNVIRTMQGEDEMYEVEQNNGITYTVNSKHTLALKYSGNKSIFWNEKSKVWRVSWYDKEKNKINSKRFKVDENNNKEKAKILADQFIDELYNDDVIEMRVDDYLELKPSIKRYLMGYKSGLIDYPSQSVDLDPYMLGLWLGDGTHCNSCIASNDKEIVDYMISWCNANDAELMKVKNNKYLYRIRRKGYGFSCNEILTLEGNSTISEAVFPEHADRTNPFMNLLKKYNLVKNKHIPREYLMNDRSIRLKLLAGIIDTDGHVSKLQCGKRVSIIQTHVTFSKQIIFLARSLGFTVNYQIRKKQGVSIFGGEKKDYKDQYAINISGEKLYEIPTLLPRKKCAGSSNNFLNTSIKVKSVGRGKYYGWEIDGANHRFLLEDTTANMNCSQMFCTICHTAFDWRTGRVETGPLHNPHYYEWMRRNGTLEREANDVPCGREINHHIFTTLRTLFARHESNDTDNAIKLRQLMNQVTEYARLVIHYRYASLPRYQYNSDDITQQLRIQYMRNFICEDYFKVALQKEYKKSCKYREICDVIQLLIATMTDIIFRFVDELKKPEWKYNLDHIDEIKKIMEYSDECFLKISRTYSSVPLRAKYL